MIIIKRVYEPIDNSYIRILVDRLWPRGVSKTFLKLNLWAKEIAPSNELRKAYNHDVTKFNWFKEKYFQELNNNTLAADFKMQYAKQNIVLLYAAKDTMHNNAIVLKEWLEGK
jgi:uncharacterized protein YeaO (DUF488 family)